MEYLIFAFTIGIFKMSAKLVKMLLVLGAYTVLPIYGLIVLLLLTILRLSSLLSATLWHPQLKGMLDQESGLTSYDDFYGTPLHTVLGVLYTSAPIHKKAVVERMSHIIQGGQFPELSQQLVSHWWQYFWGDCPQFNLLDHVTTSSSVTTYEELQEEKNRLYRKAFLPNRPLWEIVLLPNYRSQSEEEEPGPCAFILRMHHVLGDGLAFASLLDGIQGKKGTPPRVPRSWSTQLKDWFPLFTLNPLIQYRLLNSALQDLNTNSWIRPAEEWSSLVYSHEGRIDFGRVKDAAKNMGATVSEALALAVTQAVGAEVQTQSGDDTVSALYILPKPGHPRTLTNHAYVSTLLLPVNEKGREAMLHKLRADLELKKASAPFLNMAFKQAGILIQTLPGNENGKLMFSLPTRWGCYGTFCFSTAALPPERWNLFGEEVTGVCITIDVAYHLPVMIVMAGYGGQLHISLRGRADVMGTKGRPKVIVDRILHAIQDMAAKK